MLFILFPFLFKTSEVVVIAFEEHLRRILFLIRIIEKKNMNHSKQLPIIDFVFSRQKQILIHSKV
jgi:hypothetical protein